MNDGVVFLLHGERGEDRLGVEREAVDDFKGHSSGIVVLKGLFERHLWEGMEGGKEEGGS